MEKYHHDAGPCGHGEASGHGGFGHGGFGRGFRPPFGPARGLHDFARGFGGHGGRARRGDVRTAVLRLLAEQPMHGYQVIQELSSRSGGAWTPSAGSVYPTLQLLADEGLVTAEETAGKKVFSLTEAGTAAVAEVADQPAPWDEAAEGDETGTDLRESAGRLMPAIMQIGKNGSADQRTRAAAVLTEARKELYKILAED
jgi:DNA-binding PadR family transcriptional regulator